MKFGATLRREQVEEWSRAYISYRGLKKAIRRAAAELDGTFSPTTPSVRPSVSRQSTRTVSARRLEEANDDRDGDVADVDEAARTAAHDGDIDNLPSPTGSHESRKTETSFRKSGSNPDLPLTTTEPTSGPAPPSDSRLSRQRRATLTKAGDFNPKRWRRGFWTDMSLQEVLELCPPQSKRFFKLLDHELDRVCTFYIEREDEYQRRFDELRQNWKQLQDHRQVHHETHPHDRTHILEPVMQKMPAAKHMPGAGLVRRTWAQAQTLKPQQQSPQPGHAQAGPSTSDDMTESRKRPPPTGRGADDYVKAKARLKAATYEFYRTLGMLKSYRVMNRTGFAKAQKKFEKACRIPTAGFTPKLDNSALVKSDKLDTMIRETEDAFAQAFEHGDRKKALKRLRVDELAGTHQHHFANWRSGVCVGVSVVLLIEGIVKSTQAETRMAIPYWKALMQLFGAMFLPVVFVLLFHLDMTVWHSARVNYPLIFELNYRNKLDFHQFIEIPSVLLLIYSICFWLAWSNFWPEEIAPNAYPLTFLVIALTLLLLPVPIIHPSARYWMVRSFSRVITAGLVRVEFRDFFIGDEMTSLYYSMYNLGFLVCTYNHKWPADAWEVCSTNKTWASPVLAGLPAFWRLGQSVRRYFDSDGLQIHALNAGKYSVIIMQIWFYFAWRIYGSGSNARKGLWIFFSIVNSLYTSAWDLVMDWSLFRRKTKYPFLRSELALKDAVWSYYVASVLDVLLRFTWVIYLAPKPSVQVQGFIVATLEVARRILWNIYRVESEHTGNVDGYRVTRDVPLPYVTPRDASLEADPSDDANADSGDGGRPKTVRQRFFGFFHNLHSQVVDELRPLTEIRLPSLGRKDDDDDDDDDGDNEGQADKGKKAKDYERKGRRKSRGTAPDSSSSDHDPFDDVEDDDVSDVGNEDKLEGGPWDDGTKREDIIAQAQQADTHATSSA